MVIIKYLLKAQLLGRLMRWIVKNGLLHSWPVRNGCLSVEAFVRKRIIRPALLSDILQINAD